MNKYVYIFLGGSIGIALCIVFLVFVFATKLTWNWQFETSDISNLIIAIIVTYFFPITLGRAIEKNKSKIGLIHEIIKKIDALINSMENCLHKLVFDESKLTQSSVESIILLKMQNVSLLINQICELNKKLNLVDAEILTDIYQNFITFNEICNDYRSDGFTIDEEYINTFQLISQKFGEQLIALKLKLLK